MHKKVISNTSCLIVLSNTGRLDLLHEVYGSVLITDEVAAEFGDPLPEWINITSVSDPEKTRLISTGLGIGEASTIALALETENTLIILDDRKARRFAKDFNLVFTGTLGVIAKGKQMGLVTDVQSVIDGFKQCGFRMPPDIEQYLLANDN
jgi:predicted nucleic acid-binding protein